ncbi:MAG TPA: chemotaxis protein CheW [Armatimonadota bacterium]|nr:chemotaxis protein CheW [Armatimonadota bacterium]
MSSVAETLRITTEEIQRINGRDTLLHRGSVLPLVTLDQVFDIQRPREARSHLFMVVARYGQTHLGIVVDRLIGEQEIVIKPLDALIGESRGLAGASILGNGQVALILDIPAFAAEAGVNQRSRSRALAA